MQKTTQKIPIAEYKTLVFDCDGVILNSNQVKTQAFHSAAISYGRQAADELVRYHVQNGGISRYHKFEYFLRHIVKKEPKPDELQSLLAAFALEVKKGLMCCEVAKGLERLRKFYPKSRWLVASGGDQAELRDVFLKRGLSLLFNGGIFGSPASKDDILNRELDRGNIIKPALFFGDSKYDYEASKKAGLDFIFVSGWSEFKEWKSFFCDDINQITTMEEILISEYP
ncbi:MAG: HAD family hydrolase [FCB group bacterium]|nr:HAD family hydrolase [FCB group bacterium]